jgi:hypothetical protein
MIYNILGLRHILISTNMTNKYLLLFFFLFLHAWLFSQESMQKDTAFFNQKVKTYQDWLEKNNMARFIEVKDYLLLSQQGTPIDSNHFYLRLRFLTTKKDSAERIWEGWSQTLRDSININAHEFLFNKLVTLMLLNPDYCSIEVKLKDASPRDTLFFIHTDDNHKLVMKKEVWQGGITPSPIVIQLKDINNNRSKPISIPTFKSTYTVDMVSDKINNFLTLKYKAKKFNCAGRSPVVERSYQSDNEVHFEIYDLCDEVLKGTVANTAANQWRSGCKYFCPTCTCNIKPRESLRLEFNHKVEGETLTLKLVVTGGIGSGIPSEIGRKAYYDMEGSYKNELIKYTNTIRKELEQYLLK